MSQQRTTGSKRSASRTGKGRKGREPDRNPKTVAIVVGVVVLFGALLYAAFGLERDMGPELSEVAGSPEVVGAPLPPPGEDQDEAVGMEAPVVTGAAFDGTEVTIGEGSELIVFMASWCSFCRQELPDVVQWLDAGRLPSDVRFTAVVTGLDPNAPNWPPQDWLERENYDGGVLVDDADGSVASSYGLTGTPFWVALDDGRVVARASGQIGPDTMTQLASAVAG